ncbi:MAG: hypothetical protein ABI981_04550 [Betaproteobacteria bacterium]
MDAYALLPWMLVAQGAVGGWDTLFNHELVERLPQRPSARAEIGVHSLRELNYALLFAGLAWFEWHGGTAWIVLALLVVEIVVTCWDEFIENATRILPPNERILHVLLTINLGVIATLVVFLAADWMAQPAALAASAQAPAWRWLISALAIGSLAWAVRDAFAWWWLRPLVRPGAVLRVVPRAVPGTMARR